MKKVAILAVLTLATMLISGAGGNSTFSSAENNVDIKLASEETYNVQETVYEDPDEGITERELMFRNDISIKEIHDLKVASRAEIFQRLGKPHGSVSGGCFQQFHYILENGDIVVFSSSEFDDEPQRISIYNKDGELKNAISNELE